ncbi:hypothetical protein [Hymenobacter arizonensis]|uniref:Coenzyme Q (Ubiquinone) biosynthesis protein Coq4 n=1 Tax=Hymenobacter arizonensis TaxID=1227077 RepID=A0A1I6B0P0_HYMAR|nr:hypothetical protein [Hymenobacter arizonensis]SFQ74534.1 hypothetical protein SAMN04515668_4137 [Hymenobacter arizonensis]
MHKDSPVALNAYQRLVRKIVAHAETSFLIPLFWWFYGARPSATPMLYLSGLPVGTLGRAVADGLHCHGFQLIPNYENHDLKHALLGYGMTPEEELRMQAFMLGNGNRSPTCFGALLFAVLMPELWANLLVHYRQGKLVSPVFRWSLVDYAAKDLENLRQEIGLYAARNQQKVRILQPLVASAVSIS